MDPVSKKTHWVTTGDQHGDPTGEIVASREGLLHLRSQIDEALEHGIAETSSAVDFDFNRIKIQDTHPKDVVRPTTTKESWFKFGCLSILAISFLLICIGAYHVIERLLR